jgi:hypothetical protein
LRNDAAMIKNWRAWIFWLCLSGAVAASRLSHIYILWADEDYHLAAAIQVLAGKFPYRDFWYDKPPLNLSFYLAFGAWHGLPLRLADAVFVSLCCVLAYLLAAALWSPREGYLAAAALAFFSVFYLAPGIIPEEPDTLMLAPHLAAVYLAFRRRPLLAGLAAGLAFQLSVKGALVMVSAGLFCEASALPLLFVGFLIPSAAVAGWLAAAGAQAAYLEQVWKWGLLYAALPNTPAGILSVLHWLGFHAALVAAAAWFWARTDDPQRRTLLAWCIVSLGGVTLGWRFAPRYFMQILPALAIPAARGFALAPRTARICIAAALLIPAIRFGPRYVELARQDLAGVEDTWQDAAMDRESRDAAKIILEMAQPGDTIFVWGYRPDVVAYTRLPVAGRLWDSQPVTGVPADRHLSESQPVDRDWARGNREELSQETPTFLVDGLSRYNPRLDIHGYPELAAWLTQYCEVGRAGAMIVYRRCDARTLVAAPSRSRSAGPPAGPNGKRPHLVSMAGRRPATGVSTFLKRNPSNRTPLVEQAFWPAAGFESASPPGGTCLILIRHGPDYS